jgi:ElaB/YqjD/DUF883 family membrane-anchored ribosome-binding protein
VIQLLEEIRDLQRQHVENYKDALANQRESIALTQRLARRQQIQVVAVAIVIGAIVGLLLLLRTVS